MRRGFVPAARATAFLALGAAALGLGSALAGCSRRPQPPPAPVYPYRADATRLFYATGAGLSEAPDPSAKEERASKAPNASVLSSDGRTMAVAVNGWGIERIESSADAGAYRLAHAPDAAGFAGLSTAGLWPLGGGFLVQLYRDPFVDAGGSAGSIPASRLAFFGEGAAVATPLSPFSVDAASGFEPFVLFPANGGWFAELRKDGQVRVELKYLSLGDPLAPSPAPKEIGRLAFEVALRPLPLSGLDGARGASLGAALRALGEGPWLVRLRSAEGEDRWYLSSGRPEDASDAFAWSFPGASVGGVPEGAGVLALNPEGTMAFAEGGAARIRTWSLPEPQEGAIFTALAAAGSLAAAAWESGDFPNISSAGILVVPLR